MEDLSALAGIVTALTVGVVGRGPRNERPDSTRWSFFTTQVSNPKTAIVYASVFAAFMPGTQTLAFNLVLVALVFTIEASWYSLVALALSAQRPRVAYLRYNAWVDRMAGGVMVALGMKLATSAYRA